MNRQEIMEIMPHREPMLLIDQACLGSDGKAYGSYTVRGNEWFLQGHFPGNPIVPGAILCEMMAQACNILILLSENADGKLPLFAGMDKIRFREKVLPGQRIEFVCSLKETKPPFHFIEAEGSVNGRVCVLGELCIALV